MMCCLEQDDIPHLVQALNPLSHTTTHTHKTQSKLTKIKVKNIILDENEMHTEVRESVHFEVRFKTG